MSKLANLLFLSLFTTSVMASGSVISSQTEKDTDHDKVFDIYDSSPEQKVKTMSIEDLPMIQLSRISGNFNNKIEKGRYRIGDKVTLTGMGIDKIKDPVVVIYDNVRSYNVKQVESGNKGITFQLSVPQGKYKVFVYNNDKRTNDLYLEPFAADAPLIFGSTSVILTKGEEHTITGTGFDTDTKVEFGDISIKPTRVSNDSLSFKVPKSTNVRDFQVRNKLAKSNSIRVFKYN
ncbi:IPT/TIG domain protein [Pseudoalteromonas sp. P1-9]|uniref:IPT/TIG domain-containing protein n=1 Tax=Pseudoalteromonas sp. P1-9 TaxID=1710354 RepID=UPI0006D64AC2|nr:IPT/TIG domain-containing protein [Pseudoalteromonas sp. P1-9]KPV95536.1 IPT/TIG domain protein [Pseudoalteromonas sp. P1-9]